jgi:hypothetical protein
MTAVRRAHPLPVSAPEGLRAKALRPFDRARRDVSAETTEAAQGYERAARLFEARRATHPEAIQAETRALFVAAARLLDALRRESALPSELAADLERWVEGEFVGSHVDVELANHAIHDLLTSDVCAEVGVTAA